jgi:hypothetical protein
VEERVLDHRHSALDRIGRVERDGDHRGALALVDRRREQRLGTRDARVEQDLRPFRAEHHPGVLEQRDDRRIELRRVLEDPAGLVEQLEPLVFLAFRQVGAVGEKDRRQRNDEEPQEAAVERQDGHREQREAGVGDRDEATELDHLGKLLVLRRPARERDRGRDRERAQDRRTEGRRERRGPVVDPWEPVGPDQRVEDRQRQRRGGREVAQVEHDLDRGLTRADDERHARAAQDRDQVLVGRQQEEPDDGRELAQRERVLLAAKVDVDDLELGRHEPDRDHDPRHGERRLVGDVAQEQRPVQDGGQGREERAEEPDARRGGEPIDGVRKPARERDGGDRGRGHRRGDRLRGERSGVHLGHAESPRTKGDRCA